MGADYLFTLTLVNNLGVCLEEWELDKFLRHLISHLLGGIGIDLSLDILPAGHLDMILWQTDQPTKSHKIINAFDNLAKSVQAQLVKTCGLQSLTLLL